MHPLSCRYKPSKYKRIAAIRTFNLNVLFSCLEVKKYE